MMTGVIILMVSLVTTRSFGIVQKNFEVDHLLGLVEQLLARRKQTRKVLLPLVRPTRQGCASARKALRNLEIIHQTPGPCQGPPPCSDMSATSPTFVSRKVLLGVLLC